MCIIGVVHPFACLTKGTAIPYLPAFPRPLWYYINITVMSEEELTMPPRRVDCRTDSMYDGTIP